MCRPGRPCRSATAPRRCPCRCCPCGRSARWRRRRPAQSSPVLRQDRLGQGRGGQRPAGDDDVAPILRRPAGDLLADHGDVGMVVDRARHGVGKAVPIDRQRAAGRQLVLVGRAHDQRTAAPHLLMQQADGILLVVVGAEAVGADQLGEAVGLWASVPRTPRISCTMTVAPASAACQAASEPARPPPMM